MLAGLPRSARVLVLTGPLFAPAMLAGPFAVAYQDALGLSATQIGLLASASAALGFVFLLAGAAASERWGRLRAVSAFDVAGFVLPAVLLAAARSPGEVMAAVLLGSTAQGAQAGFQGLLMADLAQGQRQRVLALEHLLLALPGAAMPLLAGGAVAAWGLDAAVRALYLAGAASVALMVAVRWRLLRRAAVPCSAAPAPDVRGLGATVRALRGAGLSGVLAGSALLAFAGGLGVLAQVFVLRVAGLEAFWLGPFAFAVTAADLGATALAGRARVRARSWAIAGAALVAAGALVFVAAREPALLLASGGVLGVAGAWAGVGTGALLHDAVPEALRERAVAAQLALRAFGAAAGPAAGAWLFEADPMWPWAATALAALAATVLLARNSDLSGSATGKL